MPYTLAMFFLWGILMALIGIVIGWLLCRVRMRRRGGTQPGGRAHRDRAEGAVRGPTE